MPQYTILNSRVDRTRGTEAEFVVLFDYENSDTTTSSLETAILPNSSTRNEVKQAIATRIDNHVASMDVDNLTDREDDFGTVASPKASVTFNI